MLIALPRCQQQSPVSLDRILRYAVAPFVADTEVVLSRGEILLGQHIWPVNFNVGNRRRGLTAASENAALADKTTAQNRYGLIILLASP
jgi:hypothetical protein